MKLVIEMTYAKFSCKLVAMFRTLSLSNFSARLSSPRKLGGSDWLEKKKKKKRKKEKYSKIILISPHYLITYPCVF